MKDFLSKYNLNLVLILSVLGLGFPYLCVSQNLLPDGGFEHAKNLPKQRNNKFYPYMALEDWQEVVRGTFQAHVSHPKIIEWRRLSGAQDLTKKKYLWGGIPPKSGDGFVGIHTYHSKHPLEYLRYTRTYIHTKLNLPLKKGEVYHFEMWVRTSIESSKYFSSGLGALLTDSTLSYTLKNLTNHYYIRATPQIYCDTAISNVDDWQKVEAYYVAKGGERYLTIGNFFSNEKIIMIENQDFIPIDGLFEISFVFIDDVKLEKESPFDKLLEKKVIELPNVNFNSGSEKLHESSKPMLQSFALFLRKNKTFKIKIIGHTDNVGNASDNLILSQERAEEIKNYLVSQEVLSSRIQTDGKGSSIPIANNDLASGRKKNRRVEVELIK